MDSLPPEIWENIFYFACSDSGFTGRSLSLVSRQIHDIVKPYKLRSISVVGGPQIIKFSEYLTLISSSTTSTATATTSSSNCKAAAATPLQALPPPQTTIQNLFIGITNPRLFPPLTTSSDLFLRSALTSLNLSDDTPPPPSTIPLPAAAAARPSIMDANKLQDITIKAIHRILNLVSPTLLTLHFHFITFGSNPISSSSGTATLPFPFPMPRLSELTIYGPLLNPRTGDISSSSSSSTTIPLLTIFPALKRLRMGNFQPYQGLPTDFIPRLAISLPKLTHISIFQHLPSRHHVHSLGRLIMSPGTFWSGQELEKLIIEVDVNSVLFEENTTTTTTAAAAAAVADGSEGNGRELMLWLGKLRNCMHQTADTRMRLIETHRSWVDVETAQIEWSNRNMGMKWTSSFRTRHSVLRSSGES